eukprot:jgi/Bigna1/75814/fgenesh1_pg.37_\
MNPNGPLKRSSPRERCTSDQRKWLMTKSELSDSPSRRDGITPSQEEAYRRQGVEWISATGNEINARMVEMQKKSTSGKKTYATNISAHSVYAGGVYYQRFYTRYSYKEFDNRVVACTCLFFANKIEGTKMKLDRLLDFFNYILWKGRRRPRTNSPEFLDFRAKIISTEKRLMEALEFDFTVKRPHKILKNVMLKMFGDQIKTDKTLRNIGVWASNFINDSIKSKLCLTHPSQTIALAALYLAFKHQRFNFDKRFETETPWFTNYGVTLAHLEVIGNILRKGAGSEMLKIYENPEKKIMGKDGIPLTREEKEKMKTMSQAEKNRFLQKKWNEKKENREHLKKEQSLKEQHEKNWSLRWSQRSAEEIERYKKMSRSEKNAYKRKLHDECDPRRRKNTSKPVHHLNKGHSNHRSSGRNGHPQSESSVPSEKHTKINEGNDKSVTMPPTNPDKPSEGEKISDGKETATISVKKSPTNSNEASSRKRKVSAISTTDANENSQIQRLPKLEPGTPAESQSAQASASSSTISVKTSPTNSNEASSRKRKVDAISSTDVKENSQIQRVPKLEPGTPVESQSAQASASSSTISVKTSPTNSNEPSSIKRKVDAISSTDVNENSQIQRVPKLEPGTPVESQSAQASASSPPQTQGLGGKTE